MYRVMERGKKGIKSSLKVKFENVTKILSKDMAVHNMLNSKNPRTSIDRKKKKGRAERKLFLAEECQLINVGERTEIEKPLFYNHPSDNRSW